MTCRCSFAATSRWNTGRAGGRRPQPVRWSEAAIAVAQDAIPARHHPCWPRSTRWPPRLKRACPPTPPHAAAAHAEPLFLPELGFAGNVNDYYDPRNSYLKRGAGQRRGIPITLALLYIELASAAGADGARRVVSRALLVKLRMPQGEVVIDPFTGRSLVRARTWTSCCAPTAASRACWATSTCRWACSCRPAPPREVVARMLRNLKEIHRRPGTGPPAGGAAPPGCCCCRAGLEELARPRPGLEPSWAADAATPATTAALPGPRTADGPTQAMRPGWPSCAAPRAAAAALRPGPD